jgi:hypothetical protein
MERRDIAGQHDADLVRENLVPVVRDDAAAIAVAVEGKPDVGVGFANLGRNACSIFMSSGFGLWFGKE